MKLGIVRALLVASVVAAAMGTAAHAAVADSDVSGKLSGDQDAAAASEIDGTAASAAPVSVDGSPPGTYSTSIVGSDELLSPDDVAVITSTEPGTAALTGIVIDDASGDPVPGASITFQPSSGGPATSTSSDAQGVFALINVPADDGGISYDLSVTAPGYGAYQLENDRYEPDITYEVVVPLAAAAQSFNESVVAAQDVDAAVGTSAGYPSTRLVPPVVTVGIFEQVDGCKTGDFIETARYPWRFYVLHVAVAEIGTSWHQAAWKANAAAQQNYAWWFRRHPASSSYDIGNTTRWQCFRPERKIPTSSWSRWLEDVVDERIATASDDIQQTQYRAGQYACTESSYPADGNVLSQNGSRALDDDCGYDSWRSIDEYYYTGNVVSAVPPPAPTTSFGKPRGAVKLNYPSQVEDGGHVANVGWSVEARKLQPDNTYAWTVIHVKGWDQRVRNVPTSFTYSTSGCWRYRSKAANPAGTSQYAGYNGGNPICPG
ncbi:MAG: carboxypeptidase-like regulatory domain-containing protein [Actinomycetota bacterium]